MTPTLIVTRPTPQSDSFVADIRAAWDRPFNVIVSPLLEIIPLPATAPDVDSVIFTSVNGVAAAARLGFANGMRAWCVGAKTAQAAKVAGFEPITGPGDARGLVDDIISARATGRHAHIRGAHTRGDVCVRLVAAGIACVDVVAYDQRAKTLSDAARAALGGRDPIIFPLFSPRTGTILNDEGPFAAPVAVAALSAAVKDSLDPAQFGQITVAETPDGKAMLDVTIKVLCDVAAQT